MFSTKSVTLAIASVTALWSVVAAYPTQGGAAANVALFNLPAAITPPAGELLKAVYLGYGIFSPSLIYIYKSMTDPRNSKLHLQCNDLDVLHDRHGGSKTP